MLGGGHQMSRVGLKDEIDLEMPEDEDILYVICNDNVHTGV